MALCQYGCVDDLNWRLIMTDAERIARLERRIKELEGSLEEAIEYIDNESDMVEGPDGDEPNEALMLSSNLQNVLDGFWGY
jgi:hypothetical protein